MDNTRAAKERRCSFEVPATRRGPARAEREMEAGTSPPIRHVRTSNMTPTIVFRVYTVTRALGSAGTGDDRICAREGRHDADLPTIYRVALVLL
jgi:hypothetical protein